ncbi:MAG: hypothetical protein E7627_06880 [Ruminococcaceae bacterium]|nr:hypothetical protein [Oscillospiraceae bacterium]
MKYSFKKLLVLTIACLSLCSFLSCGNGIKDDESQAYINDFLAAIEAEDYDKAKDFLHPWRYGDLEAYFLSTEQENNVDFQSGIEIEKCTVVSSTLYDSTVGGEKCVLTIRMKVGDETLHLTFEIVNNNAGYGIYNISYDLYSDTELSFNKHSTIGN